MIMIIYTFMECLNCIEYQLRVRKLKAFLTKKSLQSYFFNRNTATKSIVSGNEFHRTGGARVKARPSNVEQLTLGSDKINCEDK